MMTVKHYREVQPANRRKPQECHLPPNAICRELNSEEERKFDDRIVFLLNCIIIIGEMNWNKNTHNVVMQ